VIVSRESGGVINWLPRKDEPALGPVLSIGPSARTGLTAPPVTGPAMNTAKASANPTAIGTTRTDAVIGRDRDHHEHEHERDQGLDEKPLTSTDTGRRGGGDEVRGVATTSAEGGPGRERSNTAPSSWVTT